MKGGRAGAAAVAAAAVLALVAAALAGGAAAGAAGAAAGAPAAAAPAGARGPALSAKRAAAYLESRRTRAGAFAEPGEDATPGLTAWAALALVAAGRPPQGTGAWLAAHEGDLESATDLELALAAERALGLEAAALRARVRALVKPDGRIGPTLNSLFWGVIALRAAGDPAPRGAVAAIRAAQARSGGWSWHPTGEPDADDTAAALLALRAAGAAAADPAVRRGLAFLASCRVAGDGYATEPGAQPNAQSTAWAVQALLAAGREPAAATWAYLAGLQQRDGSVAFSATYATTPVWVTSYALVAAARAWYPLASR